MSDEGDDETIKAIQPAERCALSRQNPSYLKYECDPLDSQMMSVETNGDAEIEERNFSDEPTSHGNDTNPRIDQVINEATKVTSKETTESSGLEILASIQPAGKSI